MQPLKKRASELQKAVEDAYQKLNVEAKAAELAIINDRLATGDIWEQPELAQGLSRKSAEIRQQIEPWQRLKSQLADMSELLEMNDETLAVESEQQIAGLDAEYSRLHKDLLYSGEFDDHAAVIKINAGAGGTDAQDWAAMLERMYLRWAEKSGLTTEMVERSPGEEAGIKSVTYIVRGVHAYGKLQSEHGVHRLVRLSPFNSDNLRQTSFAQVEVMPEIEAPDEVALDEKDLKIDVYRAGGHGGQSVNTTDSAVRVTHLPTNTVVAIQNERSQLQNKETALKILRGKLAKMQLDQHASNLADLRAGESASWGAQIRNYVLHPYTMVKDARTKHETRDAAGVLDGKIDEFIDAYMEQNVGDK